MSFIRRTTSFLAVKKAEAETLAKTRRLPIEKHDFFFDIDDINVLKAGGLPKLAEMGGIQGLSEAFRTSLENGLYEDETKADYNYRIEKFGKNEVPRKPPTPFLELCLEPLEDIMLRLLIFAGLFSLVIGVVRSTQSSSAEHQAEWIEGLAILLAVTIVCLVTAFNNWEKEKQFRVIEDSQVELCTVVRNGKEETVDATGIMVGDLVVLKQGDSIVADGIYVVGADLSVDESALTGETGAVKKDFDRPFLLSGTSVLEGEGVMLIVAVGVQSTRGQIAAALDEDREETPLQERLEVLSNQVGVAGSSVALLLFIILIIFWIVDVIQNNREVVGALPDIINFFIICITLIVVAVPEGLPLAVTISLAYSMSKMLDDNNLVRVLSACETMGNATMICSDKTGTLTQNLMTVIEVVLGGKKYDDGNLPNAEDLPKKLVTALIEGEALNSKVYKMPDNKFAGGNQTACALLKYAITLGCDYENVRKRIPIEKAYPFNSAKKSGAVLVRRDVGSRLYTKGAVEQILSRTKYYINEKGDVEDIELKRDFLMKQVDGMTRTGLRCIGLAYQDFGPVRRDENMEVIDHTDAEEEFILIGICGIKDPLRPGVKKAVARCQKAGIIVRMVTGDHLETAKFIARDAGILTNPNQIAMTGPDFRSMTDAEKAEVIPQLRVLARSSPLDKEILVRWLKSEGHVVAVTGDGTNDAPALKEADVGLAMGIQGTDVAKKACSIIILDDDFATIVKSVMWGRSVFDNIRKFVQFQITVNIVALSITLIGAFDGSHTTPLKAVQLLWVNLIMDTFAALALGTEYPSDDLLDRYPFAKSAPLISPVMWRNILSQAAYQIAILVMILFGGVQIWGFVNHSLEHYTFIFNSFVMMQLFNEVNSRKCNGEFNIFEKFFENWIFSAVMIGTMGGQVLMVEVFGSFAQTTSQSGTLWGWAILFGVISWPLALLVNLITVDNTIGQIKIDPRDFLVAPFPGDEKK